MITIIFYRIISAFIFNKNKRKNFREKYLLPLKNQREALGNLHTHNALLLREIAQIKSEIQTLSAQIVNNKNESALQKNHLESVFTGYFHEVKHTLNHTHDKVLSLHHQQHHIKNEHIRGFQRILTTASTHQKTFAGYKNKYANQDIVLFGAGPSVTRFQPIENAVYVGLNRAFLYDTVKFDYLFTIDKGGVHKIYQELIDYDCIKFIGDQNLGIHYQIPENVFNQAKNALRYKTDAPYLDSKFAFDIEYEPLGNFTTVSLQAMQFILYTNPKRVFLVGIDCTADGYFTDNTNKSFEKFDLSLRNDDAQILADLSRQGWHQLKEFAALYYPDTEIISVNPVGLTGLFKDINQG